MSNQINIFDILLEDFKIDKPIRLIELFSGIGAQAKALKNLNADFVHWKTCEWAYPSILAYNEIHKKELGDDGTDYSQILTKEEIINYLHEKGISSNYNEPMTLDQVKRLKESKLRKIYNAIINTNDLVNIQTVKGKDLEIKETDKYIYILTYSFPCQDLSLAGKGAGMTKDGGTRSGMLWEVERILDECNNWGELPQVLLMENVPQVIGQNNIKDFQNWRSKLESLGYSNYIQILNAKDYGIPQNRERTFMVSILGEYNYHFPSKIKLEKKLKDMLEENVDEKYYLSDKMIDYVTEPNQKEDKYIAIKNATKQGYLLAEDGDGVDISARMETHRGTVQKGMCQTLDTQCTKGVVVKEELLKKELCNKLIESKIVGEGDIIRHSYSNNRLNNGEKNMGRIESQEKLCPTLDTRCDCLGVCVKDEPKVIGGIGEKKSNGGTQWYQQDRIYDDNVAISVTTSFNPYYKSGLRIRKLTGKECYRLMGFSDEDYENAKKVLSENMIYHTAGDSIVVNVLMEIFKQMIKT